jgi:membrane protease YdiL (CAAX protease family)
MFFTDKPLSKILYLLGVIVIFLATYSAYFVSLGAISGYLVVYGIPIVVTSVIFGRELFKRAAKNNKTAAQLGLGIFSVFTLIGIILSLLALMIILQFNPQAQDLLNRINPALDVPPNIAWIMMAVSILVVGPAEEYLFRGFMFGGLLSIFKGKHWLALAFLSSLLFASVHGYYALTYEVISPLFFIQLVAFGFALAITFYWSGGNILVPAIIHGVYDALGFLGVATTTEIGLVARFAFLVVGLAFAAVYLPKKIRLTPVDPNAPAEGELPPPPPPSPQAIN